MGAAAMGMLNFLPTIASADSSTCAPQSATTPGLAIAPAAGVPTRTSTPTTPIVVFIDNPGSGQGVIFVGEERFELNNPAVIQALTNAIA